MSITVKGDIMIPAPDVRMYTDVTEEYTHPSGLRRARHLYRIVENDFYNEHLVQYSDDNGRTWGGLENCYGRDYAEASDGSWEILNQAYANVYNPVHGHYVGMRLQRIFRGGRKKAYDAYWRTGTRELSDHCFLLVRAPEENEEVVSLIRYEEGPEFDPNDPLVEDYFNKNGCCFSRPYVAKNGDIFFVVSPTISVCCRILGTDPSSVFPSRPDFMSGMIVGRGIWNGKTYDVTFSRPVVISDLLSSRGMDEPLISELDSGRVLVVFRGSNVRSKHWDTRIEPGAPGFKWYCYSDDGGATFTDPAPWRFDDGEVIYSSATISHFLRHQKNGKLYWVGNITDHRVSGNYPRWPLQIVEVDETYGTAKKESLTVIDTKRSGEPDGVQLSNFAMLEDRETGDIELWLAKIGQFGQDEVFRAETWKYTIGTGE